MTQLTYRNNVTLRQPIFDGFLASSQTDSAQAQLRSELETTHNVELDVALRAVESYIEIIRTQRLLAIAADNVAEHERIFGLVEKRAVTGPGLGSDVDQSTARLALAQASRERIFGELRNAEADFIEAVGIEQFSVGESGVDINQLEEPNMPESLVPSSLSSALERSAQNHPAIKAADESIKEAEAEIEVAEAPFYPRVDGELMADIDKNLSGQPGKNHTFSALGVMRWNLYQGGRDTARRRETIELLMQAKQDRLDVERRIAESVRKSWSLWITAKRRLRQLEKQADAVARVVQVFEQQFQVGGRTLLDVLDEKNELFVTKSGVATERYRELFARYELLARTGEMLGVMGFKTTGSAPAATSNAGGGQQSETPQQSLPQPQQQRGEG